MQSALEGGQRREGHSTTVRPEQTAVVTRKCRCLEGRRHLSRGSGMERSGRCVWSDQGPTGP